MSPFCLAYCQTNNDSRKNKKDNKNKEEEAVATSHTVCSTPDLLIRRTVLGGQAELAPLDSRGN